ncbi:polymer-forming cytoskeletal protein [Paenibacillus sp. MBLB4367]|uniref:bactofilin family protein n=1 Tax=Paenibacillus sp. MBLB4367 TaxID=3384767 RepID=UPI003907FAA1
MMFKKKDKPRINPNTTDTLIGEGTVYEGKIKSEASVRIEGQMIGDVECQGDVTVGEKGSVKSNLSARDVVIAGSVNGNVTAKGKLTIRATGRVFGNVQAAAFVIDDGGVFQGTSKMQNPAASTGSAAPSGDSAGSPGSDNANRGPAAAPFGGNTTVVL